MSRKHPEIRLRSENQKVPGRCRRSEKKVKEKLRCKKLNEEERMATRIGRKEGKKGGGVWKLIGGKSIEAAEKL